MHSGGANNVKRGMRRHGHGRCIFAATCALALLVCGCTVSQPMQEAATPAPSITVAPTATPPATPTPYPKINEGGSTISTRFNPPMGYARRETDAYGEYIRNLPVQPHGSPILLYDGEPGTIQDWHAAIIDLDVGTRDLQQCADAALRIRCEYLYSIGDYDTITYNLTNGYPFPYAKWREGYRLGSDYSSMVKRAGPDESYESFRAYLDVLFNYASTRSLAPESETIPLGELSIGDIFIFAGKPGHCVIVVDICESEYGVRQALLAQSSMPAQSIHIIQPPYAVDAWFPVSDIELPIEIMYWQFGAENIKRMP